MLWAGIFQDHFKIFDEPALQGDIREVKDTSVSIDGWFGGEYQIAKEHFITNNFGFHNTLIRINNQFDFHLFNKANAKEVIVGIDNFLYEKSYIDNYYGRNYKGDTYHQELIEQIKFLSDTLKKIDKLLLIVIAPGKASFYPEYIPKVFVGDSSTSNYDGFIKYARSYPDLNILDFRSYFSQLKNSSDFKLYPKYGIHWSTYGSYLANDSIIRYVENKRSVKLRRMYASSYDYEQARDIDYDIGAGMNLLFPIGENILPYPNYKFSESADFVKPNILIIGDSFFWNIYSNLKTSFNKCTFLYYNKSVFPQNSTAEKVVDEEFTKSELDQADIVMLIVTEAKIESIGWGFLNNTNNIYRINKSDNGPNITDREVKELINQINANPNWSADIRKKAKERGVSYEQAVYDDAKWFLENKKKSSANDQ